MIQFLLLISRQGKVRLVKWYTPADARERSKTVRDVTQIVLSRPSRLCNFVEYKECKVVYKRYASLYFICGVDKTANELLSLEVVHHFVEILDKYFGNVCELDLIFNFHKAYYILDELMMNGELQESSKKAVLRYVALQDQLMEQPDGSAAGEGR